MASTSTNKQPLLVDRPLSVLKDTSGALIGTFPAGTALDPQVSAGTLLVDCTQNDGAIIEYIYTVARQITENYYRTAPNDPDRPTDTPTKLGYLVNLYFCSSNTTFDPARAFYLGAIASAITEGEVKVFSGAPFVLAPVTGVGSIVEQGGEVRPTYARALYIPKGQCLWAGAVQQYTVDGTTDPATFTPLVGVQGGYY